MGILERHQARRARGEPALSVLHRPEPYQAWAKAQRLAVERCDEPAPLEAALRWLARPHLAGTRADRSLVVERYRREDPRFGRVMASALGMETGHPDAAEVVALLASTPSLPAVLIDWSQRTPDEADIRRVTRGCVELPRLPVAVVVKELTLARWLASPPSRATVLLREGVAAERPPRTPEEARSRAEALLFGALEAEPRTRGAFTLNGNQAWLFGAQEVEIDLYAPRWRLAVEVDGYHHLSAAEAYRRDRRKDMEYQLHDIFVMRLLAEDVMNDVVDAVGRVLRLVDRLEASGP